MLSKCNPDIISLVVEFLFYLVFGSEREWEVERRIKFPESNYLTDWIDWRTIGPKWILKPIFLSALRHPHPSILSTTSAFHSFASRSSLWLTLMAAWPLWLYVFRVYKKNKQTKNKLIVSKDLLIAFCCCWIRLRSPTDSRCCWWWWFVWSRRLTVHVDDDWFEVADWPAVLLLMVMIHLKLPTRLSFNTCWRSGE